MDPRHTKQRSSSNKDLLSLWERALQTNDMDSLAGAFHQLPPELLSQAAEALRAQGSAAFARKDYAEAQRCYSHALLAAPTDHRLLSNLSACHLLLQQPRDAENAARMCVDAQPQWAKGYFRLGCAKEALGDKEQAFVAFTEALRLEPGDALLRDRVATLQRELKERQAALQMVEQAMLMGQNGANGVAVLDGQSATRAEKDISEEAEEESILREWMKTKDKGINKREKKTEEMNTPASVTDQDKVEEEGNGGKEIKDMSESSSRGGSEGITHGQTEKRDVAVKLASADDYYVSEDLLRPQFSLERIRSTHERYFRRGCAAPIEPVEPMMRGLVNLVASTTTINTPKRDLQFWTPLLQANSSYVGAIAEAVLRIQGTPSMQGTPASPSSIHVGTGLGFAPVLLSRAGSVLCVEKRRFHCSLLRRIAQRNKAYGEGISLYDGALYGISGPQAPTVGCLSSNSQHTPPLSSTQSVSLCMRRPVDLLSIEAIDSSGVGLRALALFSHAMSAGLLANNAIVMPSIIRVHAALVSHRSTTTTDGLDSSLLNAYRWSPTFLSLRLGHEKELQILSSPRLVFEFSLNRNFTLTAAINVRKSFDIQVKKHRPCGPLSLLSAFLPCLPFLTISLLLHSFRID